MRAITNHLKFLESLKEPEDFLNKKMDQYRTLSAIVCFLLALQGAFSWIWDYYIDPIGAQGTIGLRSCFLLFIIVSFAFKYIRNRRVLELFCLVSGLLAQLLFIVIMNQLQNGMIYILALFVFILFFPLFLFQGFSLSANLACTFFFTIFPQIIALLGFAPKFSQPQYMILMWPAGGAMMAMLFFSAQNYRLRYESQVALKEASYTDYLTGVGNRRHFMRRLKQEIIRGHRYKNPMCLMVLDIDHFKQVNDTHGHPTGDLAIRAVADLCRQSSREIDVVARMGGEEFAILLIEAQLNDAVIAAERLRSLIESMPLKSLDGADLSLTVSIGVAEQPYGNESEEKLIELADAALYQAKALGRNSVVSASSPIAERESTSSNFDI